MPNASQPDLLREAGKALFGEAYQSPLSRALGVSDRTMRRWLAGSNPMPIAIWHDIHRLLADRYTLIATIIEKI